MKCLYTNKMNKFLLLIFLIITSICKAEHKIKIYYKQNENGYKVYADNYELCPISVKIEFKVKYNNNNVNRKIGICLEK